MLHGWKTAALGTATCPDWMPASSPVVRGMSAGGHLGQWRLRTDAVKTSQPRGMTTLAERP